MWGVECVKENITFFYPNNIKDDIRERIESVPTIWHRFTEDGELFEKESYRQPYINLIYRATTPQVDDAYAERYMLDIDFVLPSGAYATNAVDQLMYIIDSRNKTEGFSNERCR